MSGKKRRRHSTYRMSTALIGVVVLTILLLMSKSISDAYLAVDYSVDRSLVSYSRIFASNLDREISRVISQVDKISGNKSFSSGNLVLIRKDVSDALKLLPDAIEAYWIDKDRVFRAIEPPNPNLEGTRISEEHLSNLEYRRGIANLFKSKNGFPHLTYAVKIRGSNEELIGYLAVQISLSEWVEGLRSVFEKDRGHVAALLPSRSIGPPINLSNEDDLLFYSKVNAIRLNGPAVSEQILAEEQYIVSLISLEKVPAQLIVAIPKVQFFNSLSELYATFFTAIIGMPIFILWLVHFFRKNEQDQIRSLQERLNQFGRDHIDAKIDVDGDHEIDGLIRSFNRMSDNLKNNYQHNRILAQAISELSSLSEADLILKKSLEMVAKQCQPEIACFLLKTDKINQNKINNDLQKSWAIRQRRFYEIQSKDEFETLKKPIYGEANIFEFTVKYENLEIGFFRVFFDQKPDESIVILLHSLINHTNLALRRLFEIRKSSVEFIEKNLSASVDRTIFMPKLKYDNEDRFSFHFVPAPRFGGDWFALIEDEKKDRLFVITGDVAGHGLVQGLATTAINAALDTISYLIKSDQSNLINGPSEIVTIVDQVSSRVTIPNELTISCLAAEIDFSSSRLKICNAGYTFPILIRKGAEVEYVDYLVDGQQEILGKVINNKTSLKYHNNEYNLKEGDFLIFYSDGLSDARNPKSKIFGRFLIRSLRDLMEISSSESVKNEILRLFDYYTQGSVIEDDVCFLVVQFKQRSQFRISA